LGAAPKPLLCATTVSEGFPKRSSVESLGIAPRPAVCPASDGADYLGLHASVRRGALAGDPGAELLNGEGFALLRRTARWDLPLPPA
jgi:hypothetical protein